jgi:hypothetical protein
MSRAVETAHPSLSVDRLKQEVRGPGSIWLDEHCMDLPALCPAVVILKQLPLQLALLAVAGARAGRTERRDGSPESPGSSSEDEGLGSSPPLSPEKQLSPPRTLERPQSLHRSRSQDCLFRRPGPSALRPLPAGLATPPRSPHLPSPPLTRSPTRVPYSPQRGPYSPQRGPYSRQRGLSSPPQGPSSPPQGPSSPTRGPYSPQWGLSSPTRSPSSPPQGLSSPPPGPLKRVLKVRKVLALGLQRR